MTTTTTTTTALHALERDTRLTLALIALALGGLTIGGSGSGSGWSASIDRMIVLVLLITVALAVHCAGNISAFESSAQVHAQTMEGFAQQEAEDSVKQPWKVAAAKQGSAKLLQCPDVLVRRGDKFYLYNTDMPRETTILNPLVFRSLSEYIVHWRQAKARGNPCPVAYLREEKGEEENMGEGQSQLQYREELLDEELLRAEMMEARRTSPLPNFYYPVDTQIARDLAPSASSAAEDEEERQRRPASLNPLGANQRQGIWSARDEMRLKSMIGGYEVPVGAAQGDGAGVPGLSANPMDPNWGGADYTRMLLDEGYFR